MIADTARLRQAVISFSPSLHVLRVTAFFAAINAVAASAAAVLNLAFNTFDIYALPALVCVGFAMIPLFIVARLYTGKFNFGLIVIAVLAIGTAIGFNMLPEYMRGLNINGIMHRSLVAGVALLAVAIPSLSASIYYLFKATPRASDIARYPILLFFAVAAFAGYLLVLYYIIRNGIAQFHLPFFQTYFSDQFQIVETWTNGWPTFSTQHIQQVGMLNHIYGTLLLMALTSVISLPIGVGVGLYVHEYAGKAMAGIVTFSTTALRSISGVILAITAISLISSQMPGSFFYKMFHGYGIDINGVTQYGRSSFLFASLFISLLVIPIIAKATMEGLESMPRDIREGSLGLGATKEHTLFHVQLPWATPNIVTGLMLGCAEAAGALTIIFLMAGPGQFGVSPTGETTSLAYLIFEMKYGLIMGDTVPNSMGGDQALAALTLLVMTVGLTAIALTMKRQLAKRYKGA